jgi:hypothetical protein
MQTCINGEKNMKTLAKDEQGELMRIREHLTEEIEGAWANLYSSMEQLQRKHYYRLGGLLTQLRATFRKGNKGDKEFSKYCRDRFPGIKDAQRNEYVTYHKKLKRSSTSREIDDYPPIRHISNATKATAHVASERRKSSYKQIVDEEVEEPTRFEREQANESEMVHELASKIITTGFRVLSVKMHPDKDGGSDIGMRRLNAAKKLLQDALVRAAARLI